MTRSELNRYAMILTAKESELTGAMAKRDGIAIERTADALDEVLLAAARELSTRSLERQSGMLRNVRAALRRIADGSYGTCLECEEEISQKRLHAMPWATHCITCQEHADQGSQVRFLKAA
jgi:DnaK suppressor protein